jgi:hypothetical protein
MRHTTLRPSLAPPENAVRAGVIALAALTLVAAGAGTAPSQAHALDDRNVSGGEQYEAPDTCLAAIPRCGVPWPFAPN